MKTKIFLKSAAVFAVLILAVQICIADPLDPKEAKKAMKEVMIKNVPYPEFAKDNFQDGFAVVSFNVDNNGKILLKDISASTPEFKEYVEMKLKEVTLPNPEQYQGEVQYFRFDFQMINDY